MNHICARKTVETNMQHTISPEVLKLTSLNMRNLRRGRIIIADIITEKEVKQDEQETVALTITNSTKDIRVE